MWFRGLVKWELCCGAAGAGLRGGGFWCAAASPRELCWQEMLTGGAAPVFRRWGSGRLGVRPCSPRRSPCRQCAVSLFLRNSQTAWVLPGPHGMLSVYLCETFSPERAVGWRKLGFLVRADSLSLPEGPVWAAWRWGLVSVPWPWASDSAWGRRVALHLFTSRLCLSVANL